MAFVRRPRAGLGNDCNYNFIGWRLKFAVHGHFGAIFGENLHRKQAAACLYCSGEIVLGVAAAAGVWYNGCEKQIFGKILRRRIL